MRKNPLHSTTCFLRLQGANETRFLGPPFCLDPKWVPDIILPPQTRKLLSQHPLCLLKELFVQGCHLGKLLGHARKHAKALLLGEQELVGLGDLRQGREESHDICHVSV